MTSHGLLSHFRGVATHDGWATAQLLEALLEQVNDATYYGEVSRSAGVTLHASACALYHLSRSWYCRISGEQEHAAVLQRYWLGATQAPLQQDLQAANIPSREEVSQALHTQASVWSELFGSSAGLRDQDLSTTISYGGGGWSAESASSVARSVAIAHTFAELAFHRGRFAAAMVELGGAPPAMDMLTCFPSEVEESVAIGSYLQPLLELHQLQSMFEDVTIRVADPSEQNPLASAVLISGLHSAEVARCKEYIASHVQELAKDYTEVTLEVEHRVQLHLAGGGGGAAAPEGSRSATIRALCQQYQGVTIDLPTLGPNPSTQIMIRGRAASVAAVGAIVQAQVAELSELQTEVHHPLPKEYHAHVVGHEGSMITHIQDTTGATVSVPHDSEDSHYVSISGQTAEVEAAAAMVEQLRARISSSSSAGGNSNSNSSSSSNSSNHGSAATSPTSPTSPHSRHHNHHRQHSSHRNATSPPQTPGTPGSATGAASSAPQSPSPLTDADVDAAEVIIEVQAPEKFHRYLIGARGTTMKQIQNESDCMIFFPNTKNAPARVRPSSEDVVVCVGTQHACDRAQELILARVTDCHRDTGGSRDSAYLRLLHDMRERRQTQEFAGEVQVKVAAELHGFVVGGRGFVLKEIQAESGARVFLPTTKTAPARARAAGKDVITIMGPQGACAIAQQLVMARAEDAENGRRSKEDSAYMNMLQDLRSKPGTEKFAAAAAATGGASGVSSPDPRGHGQRRGGGRSAAAAAAAAVGGGGGGAAAAATAPPGKVCDECYVATEGLENDPDHPDCFYCQPCWSLWRNAYGPPEGAGTATAASATAAATVVAKAAATDATADAVSPSSERSSSAVTSPVHHHHHHHRRPAPSPSPPPAVAAAVRAGATSPLGNAAAAAAAGSPRSPASRSPHAQPSSTSPIGSSRTSTPMASPAPGGSNMASMNQFSPSPSISPPQPPLNEQHQQQQQGSGGGGGNPWTGSPSNPGSPSSGAASSMNPIEDAFNVSNAWGSTSPSHGAGGGGGGRGGGGDQAQPPEPTWGSPGLDELGAASAWSSAAPPSFSSWGSPSQQSNGGPQQFGGIGAGEQQQQQQQQPQQPQHHPDNTLSTQLYAAVIKDGMNATAANRVMEMLARLPVESMHTCLTDDALRRRMVKRCLQKLAEGDVM